MGMREVESAGIRKPKIRWVVNKTDRSYEEVLRIIENILNDTLDHTVDEMESWIKEKVPKATGKLQDNLIQNLYTSQVRQEMVKLVLKTDIDYAKYVNAMSTSEVAHSGEEGYADYQKITLNDPNAIGGFWDAYVEESQHRLDLNLTKAKNKWLGQPGEFENLLGEEIKIG